MSANMLFMSNHRYQAEIIWVIVEDRFAIAVDRLCGDSASKY